MNTVICVSCKQYFNPANMDETKDGDPMCKECYDAACDICKGAEGEIETRMGNVVCANCGTNDIDDAYDRFGGV